MPRRTSCTLLLLLAPWVISVVFATEPAAKSATNKAPHVALTIDYGDGAQKRFPKLPWTQGMTALDAMRWANQHPHGIALKYRGKNALAIVGQIDDLKNGGGDKKNWIFYINEKLADRSCGAVKLRPNDQLLWRFEVYK